MTPIVPNFRDLKGGTGHIHVHGHRGARGVLPENTMEGFKFVLSTGIRIVELDVLVTADEIPVITHNPSLSADSTRDQKGNWLGADGPLISQCTFNELQQYDIGGLRSTSEYGKRYPDQAFLNDIRIPRFSSLCALASSEGFEDVWLNIEVKSHPDHPENTPPIPTYVDRILRPIIDAGLENRVILQSFDWRVLHEVRRQLPHIPLSYLSYEYKPGASMAVNIAERSKWMDGLSLDDHGGSLPSLVAFVGGQVWSPYFQDLSYETMNIAREKGLLVNVWTVNEFADIDRMIELRVDGIITDYPGRVQRRLLERGLDWTSNCDYQPERVSA